MSTREQVEQIATSVADKATHGGALTGIFGWLADNNVIGWAGVFVGLLGLLVNWYYKHKHYKLAEKQVFEGVKGG